MPEVVTSSVNTTSTSSKFPASLVPLTLNVSVTPSSPIAVPPVGTTINLPIGATAGSNSNSLVTVAAVFPTSSEIAITTKVHSFEPPSSTIV